MSIYTSIRPSGDETPKVTSYHGTDHDFIHIEIGDLRLYMEPMQATSLNAKLASALEDRDRELGGPIRDREEAF